jgi:hypothetical protein
MISRSIGIGFWVPTTRRHLTFVTSALLLSTSTAIASGCGPSAASATNEDGGGGSTGNDGASTDGGTGMTPGCAPKKATCASTDVVLNPAISVPLTSTGARDFAVGDINGDGKADIVVSAYQTNLEVLLNNGDGTFAKGTIVDEMNSDRGTLALTDVDGDCKADSVVAGISQGSGQSDAFDVRLSKGDGTFQTAIQRDLPFGTIDTLWPTDLNHDGQIDFVIAGEDLGNSKIATTLNSGQGSFASPTPINTGYYFTTGDLTGDGFPELVSTSLTRGTGGVCVYKNDGKGGIVVPAQPTCYATSDDDHVSDMAVGDVNGDGTPDVVVGFSQGLPNATTIEVNVLLGKSDGTLGDHTSYDGLPNYDSIHLVDVNNDGKLDVVVYWGGSPTGTTNIGFNVLLNDGTGKFASMPVTYPTTGGVLTTYRHGSIGDFLGNGLAGMAAYNGPKNAIDVIVATCKK